MLYPPVKVCYDKDMSKLRVLSAFFVLGLLLAPVPRAVAADGRTAPVTVNLIIDGSLQGGEAAAWICSYVVDGMLREGDYLRIWLAGEKVQSLYGEVFKAANAEAVKALIRTGSGGTGTADLGGALRAAAQSPGTGIMTYTLLVSSSRGLSPANLGAAVSYLRYSRVMEFSGWRALVIGTALGPQVQAAAGAFLSP
jgi:hypothetical protein